MKHAKIHEICEEGIPFNRHLGIKVESIEKGRARLVLPFREEFIGDPRRPAIHGGVISTLVDMAGGAAAWSELDEGDSLSTVDMLVDYLLPAAPATLKAEAHVARIGNRVAVVQVRVTQQGHEEVVAQGRAVYSIARGRKLS